MSVGIGHLLLLSAVLFAVGLFGVLARRHAAGVLIGLQLMTVSGTVALVGVARFAGDGRRPLAGMAFAVVVLIAATAQCAVGVALMVLLRRRRDTTDVDLLDGVEG